MVQRIIPGRQSKRSADFLESVVGATQVRQIEPLALLDQPHLPIADQPDEQLLEFFVSLEELGEGTGEAAAGHFRGHPTFIGFRAQSGDQRPETPHAAIGMGTQSSVDHAVENAAINLGLVLDHHQRRAASVLFDGGRPPLVPLPSLGVERRRIDARPSRQIQRLGRWSFHLAARRNIVVSPRGLESRSGEMTLPVASNSNSAARTLATSTG